MKKTYAIWPVLAMMGLATIALGACSGPAGDEGISTAATAASTPTAQPPRDPTQKAEVSTPAAAPVEGSGDMKVVHGPSERHYLHDLMQQPDFSDAFAAMDGVDTLPAWVRKGGTATPATTVQVDGQSRLMAQACKPHDCPSEQVVLLYDEVGHAMQGVFVRDPAPGVDPGISDQAKLTWLGQPDAAVKAWLKHTLTSR